MPVFCFLHKLPSLDIDYTVRKFMGGFYMQTEKEYILGREINALRCESVGEYSLPDYNGDVKKVLLVKTQVYPAGKFVGEDLLEFSGSVG